MKNERNGRARGTETVSAWQPPQIAWEEPYEPLVFAASCTSQPFNCGTGARD